MTAAAERTKGDVGPGVTCPSFRQHPAIIAQAAATLAAMYPDRFWLGLGSGEALNEHVVGGYWPEAPERIDRMFEAIEIMRKLFSGKDVKHKGEFYRMETMRLWTMPATPPPIYVATAGPITAKKTGALCDGLITVGRAGREAGDDLREVPRRAAARPATTRHASSSSSSSTSRGPRPTRRRCRTPWSSGPTAA